MESLNETDMNILNKRNLTDMFNDTEEFLGIREDNTTDEEPFACELPYAFSVILNILNWSIPVLVVASFVGNILIVAVMRLPNNRTIPISIFFIALAVSDTACMCYLLLVRWFVSGFQTFLFGSNPFALKVTFIVGYTCLQTSSWFLVVITVDRVLCTKFPLKMRIICSKRAHVIVCLAIILVMLILNIVSLEEFAYISVKNYYPKLNDLIPDGATILLWIDLFIGFVIPLVIIVTGTIIIATELKFTTIVQSGTEKNTRLNAVTPPPLAANFTFIITMLPMRVLAIVNPEISSELYYFLNEVFLYLADSNAALSFYVYLVSGSKFRQDVKRLFRR